MKDGPNIVGIAALIGDHARAEILTALVGGEALTATELAQVAGVTKQTVSAHLAKLVDARLISVESQGRHRYFRLADRDVADLLEKHMGVAFRIGALRVRSSPREPALRERFALEKRSALSAAARLCSGSRGALESLRPRVDGVCEALDDGVDLGARHDEGRRDEDVVAERAVDGAAHGIHHEAA